MPEDSKTSKMLREMLEREAEEKAEGVTLESLHHTMHRMFELQFALYEMALKANRRTTSLEAQVTLLSKNRSSVPDWHVNQEDVITSSVDTREFRRYLDERHQSEIWWRRKRSELLLGALGSLLIALVMFFLKWLITHY